MNKTDKIYRERLERMRDDLNRYLDVIKMLPIPILEVPKIALSHLSQSLSSQLQKEESVLNTEKVVGEKETDNTQEPKETEQAKKTMRLPKESFEKSGNVIFQSSYIGRPSGPTTGRPSGSFSGGSAGMVMPPQYLRKDSGRPELDEILDRKEESFSGMLLRLIDEKKLRDSDVYRRANIDRRLFSKIRSDAEYVPSKKTAISFCLALGLELEEAKKLLATAGYALSASSRFDLIITYLIEHNEYNINFANIVLYEYGEGTLSR